MRGSLAIAAAAALLAFLLVSQTASAHTQPVFRWPWAGTDGWRYTQGFHSDYALDFQPQIAPNCGDPVDLTHTIRPVAPGTVTQVSYRGAPQPHVPVGLVIDHGGGWTSYLTHLANVPAAVATAGAQVGYDTNLGNPSCYSQCAGGVGPPCATGRHIHMQIRKDGAGSAIVGLQICGWTVGSDGGISRDGKTHYEKFSATAPIANTNCPASTPPTPGPSPTPPLALKGDADCNLRVDSIDVLLLLQTDAQTVSAPLCHAQADVDNDGVVTVLDASIILQFVAGVLGALP
jgi:murein DD-endopeptidase MepM/ murein hydrolase activator NlpD